MEGTGGFENRSLTCVCLEHGLPEGTRRGGWLGRTMSFVCWGSAFGLALIRYRTEILTKSAHWRVRDGKSLFSTGGYFSEEPQLLQTCFKKKNSMRKKKIGSREFLATHM